MMADRVRVIGPETSGLAEMLAVVVRTNVEQDPDRASFLDGPPGVIRIEAVDAGVAVSLEFRDGELRIYSGTLTAPADLVIEADSETLAGFSAVPQLGPIPHPGRAEGRAAIRKAIRGEVKMRGVVRHSGLMKRMRGLLTTDPR